MSPRRFAIATLLLVRFLWQVVLSGATTAWQIVRPGLRPVPALARMRFSNLDENGAALLGCMVTLTPGTTTIDIDMQREEILLHLLDGSDPAAVVAGIRHQFERYLQQLFPAPRGDAS
jgi:multicomponent K+:H+ antiporter subunit E/multicomponent Na+:H+ antiporter subunit E